MTNSNPRLWLGGGVIVGLAIVLGAGSLSHSSDEPLRNSPTNLEGDRKDFAFHAAAKTSGPAQLVDKISTEKSISDSLTQDLELKWRMKVFAWTEEQPEAALAWASSLADPAQRQMAVSAVCSKLAEREPARATSEATRLLDPEDHLLPDLVQQWAAKDVFMALRWVDDQIDQPQREGMLARIAFEWSRTDPAEAARLVVEKISPGATQEEAAIAVLHQWTKRDLASAKVWVELFPEGTLKERARNEVAGASHSAAMP